MSESDTEANRHTEPEPTGLEATDLDVGQLREQFDAPKAVGSLESDRAREAIHAKLFGFSDGPVEVGRFVLAERLGAGAMGIVYAAHDPRLDRKVAVKVLQPQSDPGQREQNIARLLREAKTLARLTHPNVVAVHEVGETDDGLFIAMQFVDGSNLGTWLAVRARPWRDVLRLFVGAGAGLAAAHRQDLVHRDFKPDNVLVDANDHPRVADFGLARSVVDADRTLDTNTDVSLLRVTQTGAVVGTPAYMAPELFAGRPADALSDQYALCVALYEALFGVRPFAGKTVVAFTDNARSMRLTPPAAGRDAPAWLRRTVLRGLSPNPDERFANMDALLAALERGIHRRRRVATAGLAGVSVVAAVFAYGAGAQLHPPEASTPCPTVGALLDTLWADGSRNALAAAFEADERAYVHSFAEVTLQRTDAWSEAWVNGRSDACRATHERAEQSPALMDLRIQCYELAATTTRAIVRVIAEQPDALADAPAMVATLPDLRLCADAEWVEARRPLPRGQDAREHIDAVSESLAKAHLLEASGHLDEALALAQDAHQEASRLEYAPLAAEALRLAARAHAAAGRFGKAETELARALTESLGGGDEWGAAAAAIDLIWYVGADGKRKSERERWTTVAEGIITKLGSPADLQGELALSQAIALRAEGDATGGLAAAQAGLELFLEFYGPEHTTTARAHEEVGLALDLLGRPDEGIVEIERSLAIERGVWGTGHPRVAASLINLGVLHGENGHIESCAAVLQEGLGVLEAVYGPDSIQLVEALSNLALARGLQDRLQDALALNVRARAIRERVHGPDHIQVAVNLANGGSVLTQLGRFDEALIWLEPALRIRTEKLGDDHPAVAHAHALLAETYRNLKRFTAACEHFERAVAIWSEKLGPDHPSVGATMINLGEAQARGGDRETGLEQMRRGLAVLVAARGEDHPDIETARQQLARVAASVQ